MSRHAASTPDRVVRDDGPHAEGQEAIACSGSCECCSEVARLREENAMLRAAAHAFGDLAERLNIRLQAMRNAAAASPGSPSRGSGAQVDRR